VKLKIEITNRCPDLPLPVQASQHSAGLDLRAGIDNDLAVAPLQRVAVPTGVSVAIPPGYEGQVRARSGLAIRNGIALVNAPGTIDADYRGEIAVILVNLGQEEFVIRRGDRIAQLVITPVMECELEVVDTLTPTDRGSGGFGSTGAR
jgi:dUTP pyrophosphatase